MTKATMTYNNGRQQQQVLNLGGAGGVVARDGGQMHRRGREIGAVS
jgi:hypothetical protein